MTRSSTLRLVTGVACLALVAPAAFAQPVAPEPAALEAELAALFVPGGLTSDQAATRARTSSPTVERKAAELDAASASVSAAKLGRIPRLTTKLSYTRLSSIDSPELAPGVTLPIQLDSYVAQAQLVVPLSDYVLRHPAQIDAAGLTQQAARVGVRASELDAAETARLAYYEWVRARLQVVVSGRQLAQVQATQRQIKALADAQRVPRADLLRVESLQAEAEQGHEQLQQIAALREEMLREQIGARADEALAIGEDVRTELATPAAQALDELVDRASNQRLDFRAIELAIAAKEKQRQADHANLYPVLSAFAAADWANPNQRAFLQEDRFTFTWSAGLQLTWTLNDALISRTTNRRLRAERNALHADRANLERATRIEVLAAQQGIAIARSALATSRKRLVAAEEGYRVRKAMLDAERATAVELVDAETELTGARISALDALVDLRIASTQLDHATGDDTK